MVEAIPPEVVKKPAAANARATAVAKGKRKGRAKAAVEEAVLSLMALMSSCGLFLCLGNVESSCDSYELSGTKTPSRYMLSLHVILMSSLGPKAKPKAKPVAKVRGKGKAVAVVDSHRLIQGPLHRNMSIDIGRPGELLWLSLIHI